MTLLLDFLYLLAGLAMTPTVVYRMAKHKRYHTGWSERFGAVARKDPQKKCIWLHAVSVGEVNAANSLVKELEKKFPHFEIIITTTTDTGFARANAIFAPRLQVVYFPFDLSWVISRAFSRIQPSLCLLMELEVWPNFVRTAAKRNVPVVVVNGRISEKSFRAYRLLKPVIRRIFENVTLILAQTDQYAQRFAQIGCPADRVIITGSLKYDTAQIQDKVEGSDELAAELNIKNEKLFVAGGTGNDEEKIIIDAYRQLQQHDRFKDLRLVIVPRKPERFNEVAQLIQQAGFGLIRYSKVKQQQTPHKTDHRTIILGDTMGDLRKFYSLAAVIFVGRSLVPMGGSDMAEAAALGKCTIFGPHTSNFKQTVDALLADKGAIRVTDKNALLEAVQKCLTEPSFAAATAQAGREVIRKNQGATARTIDQIEKFLNPT